MLHMKDQAQREQTEEWMLCTACNYTPSQSGIIFIQSLLNDTKHCSTYNLKSDSASTSSRPTCMLCYQDLQQADTEQRPERGG